MIKLQSKRMVPALAAAMALTLAACGGDTQEASVTTTAANQPTTTAASALKLTPVGTACSQVPTTGEGSVQGMADDPVGTAASNNPLLKTLVTAVTKANLVDTLNGPGPFTVFAPIDPAFAKVPAADLNALLANQTQLTSTLTYHVVPGAMPMEQLTNGKELTTVNGAKLMVTKTGDTIKVGNANATVICANVPVANGVVHLIDTVLTPPAK